MSWDTPRSDGDVYYASDHNETINQIKAKALLTGGTLDDTTLAGTTPLKWGLTPTVGATPDVGSFYWKETEETPTIQLTSDVALPLGQKEFRRVYNASSTTAIPRGKVVYTSGVGGSPVVVTAELASASSATTAFVLGVTAEEIAPETQGFVVVRGHVGELDTTGFSTAGSVLYLSTTPGELTETIPDAPNLEIRVGRLIVKDGTNGKINVRINQAYQLNDLADVSAPSPSASQILKYNGESWVAADAATISSAGGTDFYPTGNHAKPIEGLSNTNPCVVTMAGHGQQTGASIFFYGITQTNWTVLNGTTTSPITPKRYIITYVNENSFSIPVDSTTFGTYIPATDPGTYSTGTLLTTPETTITTQTDSVDSTGSTEVLMTEFCTPSALGRTSITAGEWTFKTWCYASSTTDTNTIVIRVSKMNSSGTRTELFNVETTDLGTVNILTQTTTIQPAFSIDATDRLVVAYYGKSSRGSGLYRTLYMTHGGTTAYSFIKTPLSLGHASLGQLTYADSGHVGFAPIASPVFTGNVTIPAGTHSIKVADYITLYVTGAMVPKTNPPAVVDQEETGTNKNNFVYASFPTSDNNTNLQWLVNFPADWTATGDIEANFIWTCATGGNTVVWQLYGKLFPDGAALDTALAQIGGDVTDTALDTGDIMVSPATTAAAIPSVGTGGNTAIISVKRNSGTKSEVAKLIAVRIKFQRTLA